VAPEEVNSDRWQLGRLEIVVIAHHSYFILPSSPRYPLKANAQESLCPIAHEFRNATVLLPLGGRFAEVNQAAEAYASLSLVLCYEDMYAWAFGTHLLLFPSSSLFDEADIVAIPGSRTKLGASPPREYPEAIPSVTHPATFER
jgi:hypothetical protein